MLVQTAPSHTSSDLTLQAVVPAAPDQCYDLGQVTVDPL